MTRDTVEPDTEIGDQPRKPCHDPRAGPLLVSRKPHGRKGFRRPCCPDRVILAVSDSCLWPLTCEGSPVGGSSCTARGSGLPATRGHAACQPAGPMCRSQDLLSLLSLLPALAACGPPPTPACPLCSQLGRVTLLFPGDVSPVHLARLPLEPSLLPC